MEMQRGGIYVLKTEQTEYVFAFDRLEYNEEWDRSIYFDYFCVDTGRGMKVLCNDSPLTINPLSIREATQNEREAFFSRIMAELLRYKLSEVAKYESDDAGQEEGK